jgi:hypothetical protein
MEWQELRIGLIVDCKISEDLDNCYYNYQDRNGIHKCEALGIVVCQDRYYFEFVDPILVSGKRYQYMQIIDARDEGIITFLKTKTRKIVKIDEVTEVL